MALLDPKGAPHDIVQAIGRALRQKPGQGKVASLIVPVFLQPGEDPEDMFTSGSYRPLVKVLEGLRAHDEEAIELLAIPQEPQKDVVQSSEYIGPPPEEGEDESRLLLRFAAPRDPMMVADWVSFNVIDTEKQDWARGWASLKKFAERELHARVPYGHKEGAYPLGQWVAEQRRAYGAGQMTGQRAQRLEKLGMVWNPAAERFQENLEAAKAYYDQHWTLCAPAPRPCWTGRWGCGSRICGDPARWRGTPSGRRRSGRSTRTGTRRGRRSGSGITPWCARCSWRKASSRTSNPGSPSTAWTSGSGSPSSESPRCGPPWSAGSASAWRPSASYRSRQNWKRRMNPSTTPVSAFEKGVAALAQYKARVGSVKVPRAHVEAIVVEGQEHLVKLGVWTMNQKSRRDKLTADKLTALAALGIEWAA